VNRAPLLRVEGLSVAFDTGEGTVGAVDGIAFEVAAGETLALVGESGSGNSVTALALMGLLPAASAKVRGTAIFGDTDLLAAPEPELRRLRGSEVAMIFQDPLSALNPVMRVGDQVAEQILAHEDVSREAARSRAVELLGRVGLQRPERQARAYPHELSGGMRQRAMIAMAISCGPKLLIADEPTTALDVTVQARILDLIRELGEEIGIAVLLITHDFGVVAQLADRVAVMRAGRLVEQGAVAEVFGSPRDSYTRALLDAVPRLDGPLPEAPGASERPLMELEAVEVAYGARGGRLFGRRPGVRAVGGVTLTIGEGEAVGLVGESGSGKTSLARAAVRLIDPTAGAIRFAGADVTSAGRRRLDALRADVQIVFQDPRGSLNPRRRVRDTLALPLRLAGTPADELGARTALLLDSVGLSAELADRWPHELSGGQAQRIGIARALARDPRLLVLDEPVSALDVSVQARILELLADLRRDRGLAYLLVSHDLGVVRQVCDRVAVMKAGEIVELGPTEQIYSRPAHPYTAELLAATAAPLPRPLSA
jgi:peptide/nickel transport system ATP-binding protein